MTRAEKVAEAVRLHHAGLSDRQIAERFGVTKAAVWKWRHPERTRELNRIQNARRQEAKNAWQREAHKDPARLKPCPKCGGPTGQFTWSAKSPAACASCVQAEIEERWQQIEAWWAEGATMGAIEEWLGWTHGHLCVEMDRMRKVGRELAYRRTPEQRARIREARWAA